MNCCGFRKQIILTVAAIAFSLSSASAGNINVYAKDNAMRNPTMSNPSVYLQNMGSSSISDFKVSYFFTIDMGVMMQINDDGGCSSSIETVDVPSKLSKVVFTCTGKAVNPGELFPTSGEFNFELKETVLTNWNHTNDYSNDQSETFAQTNNIMITSSDGTILAGSAPTIEPPTNNGDITVFSRDEGLHETNASKPRIYLKNNGTTSYSDFKYYYNFTVENGKTPILKDYYTPDASLTLISLGNGEFQIEYDCTGKTLEPGQTLPASTVGNSIGLHFSDWSLWDASDDISNNQSATFAENNNITVIAADGTILSGSSIYPPESSTAPVANAGDDIVLIDTDLNGVEVVPVNGAKSLDPDGTIVTYTWHTENWSFNGKSLNIPMNLGVYKLTLTVTDNDGNTSSDDVLVTITEPITTSAIIYMKDEGATDPTYSKPRIYVKNTSSQIIRDYYYYYYFTVTDGNTPTIDDWYTPNCNIVMEYLGNNDYRIKYDFAGKTLAPGTVSPNTDGNVIGIRNTGNIPIDASDDYSHNGAVNQFMINDHIVVYDGDGNQIFGVKP